MFPGGTVDFGTTAGTNHEVAFQRWGGPVTIKNLKSGDTVFAHGNGTFILDSSCTGGSFRVAGMINLMRNDNGAVSVLEDGRITRSGVAAQVWDSLKADHITPDTFGDYLDTEVSGSGGGGGGDATLANQVTILANLAAVDTVVDSVNVSTAGLAGSAMRGTDSANTVVPASAAVTVAGDATTQAAIAALNDFNPATDTVANVTLVATTTDITNHAGGDDAATIYTYFTAGANEDAFKADVSTLSTAASIAALNNFNPAVDTVTTDSASRTASQADVSTLQHRRRTSPR